MARRKSVQELVKPLRKLSLLGGTTDKSPTTATSPDNKTITELQTTQEHEQCDIVSWLPRELGLYIFTFISFPDLVQAQLTCRVWCRIVRDPSIWKARYYDLHRRFPDLYFHKQPQQSLPQEQRLQRQQQHQHQRQETVQHQQRERAMDDIDEEEEKEENLEQEGDDDDDDDDDDGMSWQTKYCRAQTHANWRMGIVQRKQLISDHNKSRILSVKLKKNYLITLTENNTVSLYQYTTSLGFRLVSTWNFGDPVHNSVECIDILPEINILAVAMCGSKCVFYDINEQSNDPIQVLKGGNHPWFIPDSIALSQDYFAVSGRKPSAVFIWNWRKGVRLSNRAFDNQPHSVYIVKNNVIMISVDGLVHVFDIFDPPRQSAAFNLPPCNMPCLGYDGSLSIVIAPFAAHRIHHFKWDPTTATSNNGRHNRNRKSNNNNNNNNNSDNSDDARNDNENSATDQSSPPPKTLTSSISSLLFSRPKRQRTTYIDTAGRKAARSLRRYSSYNEYGYACQARTAYYIKQVEEQEKMDNRNNNDGSGATAKKKKKTFKEEPNFQSRLRLISSIRTSPLGWTTRHIVSMAVHNDRVAIVNRRGGIALFALNGTTAADVTLKNGRCQWIERDKSTFRDGDDLSDGYDFVRSRLAMGDMGIIYGGRDGKLWWLDFSCRPDEDDISSATPLTSS